MCSADPIPPLPNDLAALKDEGNDYFRGGDFLKAASAYTKAIKARARPPPSRHLFVFLQFSSRARLDLDRSLVR